MKIEDYKISIVIPTFNRIGSLPRALDSALNQTYQPSEIIVVDNGSSDGTTKLLRERYPSIRLLIEKKLGVSAARNKGIRHSKFQWIALLDSDDAWDKTKLEKQKNALASSQDHFRLVHTDEIWIRNGNKFNQMKKHQKFGGDIFNNCLSLCCISPSSVLINKNIFKEVGYFDEFILNGPGFEINTETGDYKLGRFIEGLINGYALAYHNEDNLTFYGDSKEGNAHGFGYEIENESKSFYVGMWKNNSPNGYGEKTVFLDDEKKTIL